MYLMNLLSFVGASVLITLMPGPDIIFVITQSISSGRKSGIVFASGLSTGLIFHTLLAALGVCIIIINSPTAYFILKYLGAAYLVYLGFMAFFEKSDINISNDKLGAVEKMSKIYKKGILMNILNPKVSLFFLAYLPQFTAKSSIPIVWQMTLLGAIFMLQAFAVLSGVAFVADYVAAHSLKFLQKTKYIAYIKSSVYFLFGLNLVFGWI